MTTTENAKREAMRHYFMGISKQNSKFADKMLDYIQEKSVNTQIFCVTGEAISIIAEETQADISYFLPGDLEVFEMEISKDAVVVRDAPCTHETIF